MQRIVNDQLGDWFEKNPAEGKDIVRKAQAAASARIAARKARDLARSRKGLLGGGGLPGQAERLPVDQPRGVRGLHRRGRLGRRLGAPGPRPADPGDPADPRQDPQRREGPHRQGAAPTPRSRRSSPRSAPASTRSSTIDKLRYHKIVLMADADVDGHHINTLLLTLLFRFMRPLIEHGYVYMAQPPLYRLRWNKPAEHEFVYSDAERDAAACATASPGQEAAQGEPGPALQGSRRDERRGAVGDHDGPRASG